VAFEDAKPLVLIVYFMIKTSVCMLYNLNKIFRYFSQSIITNYRSLPQIRTNNTTYV
jgi:hypothetical protein